MSKKTLKILLVSVAVAVITVASFFLVKAITTPPLTEVERALQTGADQYGSKGETEAEALLTSITKQLSGEVTSTDSEGAEGCLYMGESGNIGGQWRIDAMLDAKDGDLKKLTKQLAIDYPELESLDNSDTQLLLQGDNSEAVSIIKLTNSTYKALIYSSCKVANS